MLKTIAKHEKYELCENDGFYFIEGLDYTNMTGTREEVKQELLRWKSEVDMNNKYMLDMENHFIKALS